MMTRARSNMTSSSVMFRKLKRLRVTVIFYTCASLCAILLLVNFNEDVKRLLQQSQYSSFPHDGGGSVAPNQLPPSAGEYRVPPFAVESSLVSSRDVLSNVGPSSIGSTGASQSLVGVSSGSATEDIDATARRELNIVASGSNYGLRQHEPTDENQRPWFMWRGTKFPSPSLTFSSPPLWHEDAPNSDRIVEQLMVNFNDPLEAAASNWTEDPLPLHESSGSSGFGPSGGTIPGLSRSSLSLMLMSSSSLRVINSNRIMENNDIMSGSPSGPPASVYSDIPQSETTALQTRPAKVKTILLYYGLGMSWGAHITNGRHVFLQQKCPVNACRLTGNRAHISKVDAVVFKDVFMNPKIRRLPHQLWIMYMLECPLNTQNFIDKNVFNLTATYRHDSDIVTPYEKWVYYDDQARSLSQGVNYAAGKTKKVAWFVSNCVAKNNRLEYARELGKHIEVDIYGACGTHSCSRANAKQCFELLAKHYKFYLAFENSNCRDYISEKFFVNGLGNNVLPIVMGAHPDDYKRMAPQKSYIHVDDFATPKELAQYLHQLDSNDDLYNEYFQWKGTGEFVNTHFFCRLCAMVHHADRSDHKPRVYEDFNKWWRGPNVCTRRSWRDQPDIFAANYADRQMTYRKS